MNARIPLTLTHIGGPTVVVRIGGMTIVSDPTFDDPQDYDLGRVVLHKLTAPALELTELGAVDLALVSHDEHPDNLDVSGRRLIESVPLVLTTPEAFARLCGQVPGVHGLAPWESIHLERPDGGGIVVTAVPARHGPVGSEPVVGAVTGFVVQGEDVPTTYLSGDNAGLDLVEQVARRFPRIDIAVLHAGAVRNPQLGGPLTLTAQDAAAAAGILDAGVVVPVHTEGWGHFTEGPDLVEKAFADAGLEDRLRIPPRATPMVL